MLKKFFVQKENPDLNSNWKNHSMEDQAGRNFPFTILLLNTIGILWYLLYVRDEILYKKWESNNGCSIKWQLVLLKKPWILDILRELYSCLTGSHFEVMKVPQKVKECFHWNKVR